MKTAILCTVLALTACAGEPRRPDPIPPAQYVLPVNPGDIVTIRSPRRPVGDTSATGASQGAQGSTRTSTAADTLRTRAAAPTARAGGSGYDALLSSYSYPFEVRYFDLRSQDEGLRMAYIDEAPVSANGRTVVLLHGANFTASYWDRTIRALTAQGFRVVAPDQLGFGKSSKPVRYQFSFASLCENTRRLLQSLGVRRASFVGHSMGGMLAVRCAIQHPELVDRLVLVNPIGLEDWAETVPYEPVEDAYHRELTQTADDLRAYARRNYFGGNWSPVYEALLDPLFGWMDGPDRARVAWDRALVADMIFTQPVIHDFHLLSRPTLLIIGQQDRTAIGRERVSDIEAARLGDVPALARAAARTIKGSRLVELPLAGHVPMVDSFDDYARALADWLER